MAMTADPREPVERKWRVGPPTSGVQGSLYDFVRRFLCNHDGACSRDELREALQADPVLEARLANGRGFNALINNMRHSGDIVVEDQLVTVTARTLRRLGRLPDTGTKTS